MRCETNLPRCTVGAEVPQGLGVHTLDTLTNSRSAADLPAPVRAAVQDLLARLDRAVPGRVEAFYVVGSACVGAFREGRSDIDLVAIVDRELTRRELAQLRAIHLGRWAAALVHDVALRRRWPLVCNGSYLRPGALARSPLQVFPVAG
jgi:predicted nucleotidyltransferase